MTKTILHVGAGHPKNGALLPASLRTPDWTELRLDIDPANEPHIVGSMLDMPAVADGSMDAIYSAHNIEHVYPYEVPVMLKEFLRVLKPDGFLVVTCPDLQTVAQLVVEDKLIDAAYQSQAGPITPLDILYGYRPALAQGNHFMAHKCGFTLTVLLATLQTNGFAAVAGKRRWVAFDLWAVASKGNTTDDQMRTLAGQYLPV
jgi:protein O-GlcNAc transferase